MTRIPDTSVCAVFQPVGGPHPRLYYGGGEDGLALASMNAGNSPFLFVGGGGINSGFAHALRPQKTDDYEMLHKALADAAPKDGFDTRTYDPADPMAASTICNKRVTSVSDHTGIAFVDAFADELCPHGNTANRAMLYVAPPDGGYFPDDVSFLAAVTEIGTHAIEAVAAHNRWAGDNAAPRIAAIRLCMYSSGIYRRAGVSLDRVALAIFAGIETGLQADADGLDEVQMPVSSGDNPYFDAVRQKLEG